MKKSHCNNLSSINVIFLPAIVFDGIISFPGEADLHYNLCINILPLCEGYQE
jgi:hypothetical protein